jgi:hypothetical protein
MVDWDRVEELRSKGWDWDRIAADPKVGFHPDTSVKEQGRALRGLYHRQRSRRARENEVSTPRKPTKEERDKAERKWTLPRAGYLLVPVVGVWFGVAYLAPSPVGLILPAIPWLALGLAVVAFLLIYGLLRSEKKWSPVFRTTLISGVILGLVVAGLIGITASLAFGCPYLPPQSLLSNEPGGAGWAKAPVSPWQDGGAPIVFFFGATWCPYCSASSWAVWKALTDFGTVTGANTGYSSSSDVYASTPEIVLAGASFSSSTISLQVSEDQSGVDGNFPTTSNCYQNAYVTAYSGSSIPFVVVNGQYVHGGSSLIDPSLLSTWAAGNNGGAASVEYQVANENGTAWTNVISNQAWWVMAFLTKAVGDTPSQLSSEYHWTPSTLAGVQSRFNQIT